MADTLEGAPLAADALLGFHHREPSGVGDLPPVWRARAELLRPYAEAIARAFDDCAGELEAALRTRGGELLSLRQAARETGYSAEHLGRLVRDRKLENFGRTGRPLLQRENLPRKPRVAGRGAEPYDLAADARALLDGRKGTAR